MAKYKVSEEKRLKVTFDDMAVALNGDYAGADIAQITHTKDAGEEFPFVVHLKEKELPASKGITIHRERYAYAWAQIVEKIPELAGTKHEDVDVQWPSITDKFIIFNYGTTEIRTVV